MNNRDENDKKFSHYPIDLPILIGEDHKYVPVIAVFRNIPIENIDEWVMFEGKPRNDRDIATEILVEVRGLPGADGRQGRHYSVAEVLAFELASALIVSVFLSKLPRADDRPKTEARRPKHSSRSHGAGLQPSPPAMFQPNSRLAFCSPDGSEATIDAGRHGSESFADRR
ncbi:hypothetical protein QFZ42_002790 [Variovorax paradoxus]|uniref:hypothetical protein n=1 Tax=Variovorax paradoxus TaxID=34073 RepID=UPI002791FD12|nr:hypothetical protein [Variovorax paradoxus]MDQ0570956.1 hypothetical protein [Variovorax paradoxus]